MSRLLYLVFFLSGAAGLVYQVLWLRLTGLVFGNTTFSIAIVLGAFMAGLALGTWRIGILADRVARPLKVYGWLEILIGVSAWLVPVAFRAMDGVYWRFADQFAALPGADFAVRFAASFAIMLVPTCLMGGTLPVMARLFVKRLGEVEQKLATLYALNTFGAALGVLAAALVLIPALGQQATTTLIAALNVALGLAAIALDRRLEPVDTEAAKAAEEPAATQATRDDRLVLLTVAVSGFVALAYEVAWTRALTALISSSTYAFAIMLVTFLVGIAAGSSWAARYRPAASLRLLGLFQLAIAIGALVFLVGYIVAPVVLVALVRALDYAFPAVLTIQFAVSAALMIGATFFMGATLPIAAQLYSSSMRILGRRIGGVYSVNTLGAIAGALCAGFVLVPSIGTERTVLAGLGLSAAVALALFGRAEPRSRALPGIAALLLVVALASMRGEVFWQPGLLDRGVLIYARQFETRPNLTIDEHYAETDVVYFAEGRNATVSVRRGSGYVGLRTNGKVDASNGNDKKTQLLLAYLPGLHHPAPREVLVIGYGSGVTSGAATVFPATERVDTVEIEPAVFGAGPWFGDYNRGSWEHPKVRLIEGDARNHLNVSGTRYEMIISEPSNPWIAGIGNLFTAEFYELAARSLAPGGVFAQWLPLYELSPANVRMVLGEIARRFRQVSVWQMDAGDIIVLASDEPLVPDTEALTGLWENDASLRRDFREFLGLDRPLGLLSYYVTSGAGVRDFADGAARNTDDRPLLEFNAPKNLYARTLELNVGLLEQARDRLLPAGLSPRATERALLAVVDPFLATDRFELASRAVTELATSPRLDDESLYLAMAAATIHTTQFADAETALAKAAAAAGPEPRYPAYFAELQGRLAARRGDREAAIAMYREAARFAPGRPDYLLELAELHAFGRDWGAAISWLQRYLALDPYPPARYRELLGDYLLAAGRESDAVQAYREAIGIDPYALTARLRLAEYHASRGDAAAAIGELEFLSTYGVDLAPEVYDRLGALYLAEGDRQAARRVLDKGARIFPASVAIHERRRQVLRD
ncbi:MAG: fused MFS/spermidine synthase [Woeseiaceae bacterium]|nr:fused MFS/spermidine synthase [Woeseiaceae bacterium]